MRAQTKLCIDRVCQISAMLITAAACSSDPSSSSTAVAGSAVSNSSTSVPESTTNGPVVSEAVTTPPSNGCEGQSLLVDCSFELPVVSVGGYQLFAVGTDFSGWTVTGAPGNVAPLSEAFASAGFVWSAHDGKQTLDLTGLSNTRPASRRPFPRRQAAPTPCRSGSATSSMRADLRHPDLCEGARRWSSGGCGGEFGRCWFDISRIQTVHGIVHGGLVIDDDRLRER